MSRIPIVAAALVAAVLAGTVHAIRATRAAGGCFHQRTSVSSKGPIETRGKSRS